VKKLINLVNYSKIWPFLLTNPSLVTPSLSPEDYEPWQLGGKAAEQLMV